MNQKYLNSRYIVIFEGWTFFKTKTSFELLTDKLVKVGLDDLRELFQPKRFCETNGTKDSASITFGLFVLPFPCELQNTTLRADRKKQ